MERFQYFAQYFQIRIFRYTGSIFLPQTPKILSVRRTADIVRINKS